MSNVPENRNQKTFVVVVPDHRGRIKPMEPLMNLLKGQPSLKEPEKAFWLPFEYYQSWYSNKDTEEIAGDLAATIKNFYESRKGEIGSIILSGHSMGAALVRRAYLNAIGFGQYKVEEEWASLVNRIVLLGAISRGMDPKRLPLYLKPVWFVSRLFGIGKMRRSFFYGGGFIGRLRVDWIRYTYNGTNAKQPMIVHLLGTEDSIVSREDVLDMEQFPSAIPIDVPNATHASVIVPTINNRALLINAFVNVPKPSRSAKPEERFDKVFFLMHGIRDSKKCFDEVAKRIEALNKDALVIHPSYGYLSIREFLIPPRRKSFIPWFIDRYSQCLAANPKAEFYYAGHSNGTYILGEALKEIPRMRFNRVYLAGSVLPQEYDWEEVIDRRKQVQVVRSDIGSIDWAVGILARALHSLSRRIPWFRDIGSGGYDRFHYGNRKHLMENVFPGGHGDMLKNYNISSIVKFLTTKAMTPSGIQIAQKTPGWFSFLHKYGDIVLPLTLVSFVVLVGPWLALAALTILWIVAGRY